MCVCVCLCTVCVSVIVSVIAGCNWRVYILYFCRIAICFLVLRLFWLSDLCYCFNIDHNLKTHQHRGRLVVLRDFHTALNPGLTSF